MFFMVSDGFFFFLDVFRCLDVFYVFRCFQVALDFFVCVFLDVFRCL